MNAFESLVSGLQKKEGYWTEIGYKVELTKEDKRRIGRPSSPRWEIDVVAYKGKGNQVLTVECKSYLDSPGVAYAGVSGGNAKFAKRYKLFNDNALRKVVLGRLAKQLVATGACPREPKITLCLAAGKVISYNDREKIKNLFARKGWRFFDDEWIHKQLKHAAESDYEDNVATIASKILIRKK